MTRHLSKTIPSLLFLYFCFSSIYSQNDYPVVGKWAGEIVIPHCHVPIGIEVSKDNGRLKALFENPAQSIQKSSFDSILQEEDEVLLFLNNVKIELQFAGEDSLQGRWLQNNREHHLYVVRGQHVQSPSRPQTPTGSFPYLQDTIRFQSDHNYVLEGTLTYPSSKESSVALILLTGSGSAKS